MDVHSPILTSFQIDHEYGEYYVEIIGSVIHFYENSIPLTLPNTIRAIGPEQVFMSCGNAPNTDSIIICTGFNRAGFPEYTWISRLGHKKFVALALLTCVNCHDEHWAQDAKGNYYLLAESVILRNSICLSSRVKAHESPYDYYYANRDICPGSFPESILGNFDGITACSAEYAGKYLPCMLQYHPTDFYEVRLTRANGSIELLSGGDYQRFMDICGRFAGFAPFAITSVKSRHNK